MAASTPTTQPAAEPPTVSAAVQETPLVPPDTKTAAAALIVRPSKSMQLAKRSTVADDCIITSREAASDKDGFWSFCGLLAPGEKTNPPANMTRTAIVAAKVLAGAELGFPPMTSVRMFHYIDGQLAISGHAMKAKAIQHGVRFEYREGCEGKPENWWCECSGTRTYANGGTDQYQFRYDMNMARKAGLVRDRSPWDKTPWAMVRKTATIEVCRVLVPDVLGGLYDPDEIPHGNDATTAAADLQAGIEQLEG